MDHSSQSVVVLFWTMKIKDISKATWNPNRSFNPNILILGHFSSLCASCGSKGPLSSRRPTSLHQKNSTEGLQIKLMTKKGLCIYVCMLSHFSHVRLFAAHGL